jgi:hypothetical protein
MNSLVKMVDVNEGLLTGSLFSDLKIFVRRLFCPEGQNCVVSIALWAIKVGEVIGEALSDCVSSDLTELLDFLFDLDILPLKVK